MIKMKTEISTFLIMLFLAVGAYSMYVVTFLSMWDYPTVSFVSSIWGVGMMLSIIYLYSSIIKNENKKYK